MSYPPTSGFEQPTSRFRVGLSADFCDDQGKLVSVPGVDVAWVGHYDLTVSMGIPAEFDHPRLLAAMDALVAACRKHGVAPGFLPPSPVSALHWIDKGFRAISLGSDIGVFLDGVRRFRAHVVQRSDTA
jgi:2-keto-3-deoxy-L-rhamnonate aldolase RhmA